MMLNIQHGNHDPYTNCFSCVNRWKWIFYRVFDFLVDWFVFNFETNSACNGFAVFRGYNWNRNFFRKLIPVCFFNIRLPNLPGYSVPFSLLTDWVSTLTVATLIYVALISWGTILFILIRAHFNITFEDYLLYSVSIGLVCEKSKLSLIIIVKEEKKTQ